MKRLFTPLKIRGIEFKNRIFVSPMCQYSAEEGFTSEWHFAHLGSRAVGGAALVIAEATAVSPEGRITPNCLGIWDDKFIEGFKKITDFIKAQNCVPGIQIAHAGRKGSTYTPWKGHNSIPLNDGGWQTVAPSAIPFADGFAAPKELSTEEIKSIVKKFAAAAERSVKAGFEVIEIHMAHGYLVHQFLSPLSNKRTDEYGGSLENRCRLAVEIASAVRKAVPDTLPLFVRVSATDWVKDGWDADQSVELVKKLKESGVDFIDCSSGGNVSDAKIPVAPGYQVQFAEKFREETGILTGAVGVITQAFQADNIIVSGQADAVLMAREFLRDPYFPLHAAKVLGFDVKWPVQYSRAK